MLIMLLMMPPLLLQAKSAVQRLEILKDQQKLWQEK